LVAVPVSLSPFVYRARGEQRGARIGPRIKKLRGLLAKLDPASAERTVAPYPPPRPSAEPSLLYRKLKGGSRRR
jgi:hypothetical protein